MDKELLPYINALKSEGDIEKVVQQFIDKIDADNTDMEKLKSGFLNRVTYDRISNFERRVIYTILSRV